MLCDLKLVNGHDRRHNTEVHARDVHLIETILPIFAFIDTGDKGVVIVFFYGYVCCRAVDAYMVGTITNGTHIWCT